MDKIDRTNHLLENEQMSDEEEVAIELRQCGLCRDLCRSPREGLTTQRHSLASKVLKNGVLYVGTNVRRKMGTFSGYREQSD
jgi:hypothetical protein